jgi:hypothetical protein
MTIFQMQFIRKATGSSSTVTLPQELTDELTRTANANEDQQEIFRRVSAWAASEFPGWESGNLIAMTGQQL